GVLLGESRVVGGLGHIHGINAPAAQLPADGGKNIPVPLVVGENHKGVFFPGVLALAAGEAEPELDPQHPQRVDKGSQNANEHRKEHTPGARVDVKNYLHTAASSLPNSAKKPFSRVYRSAAQSSMGCPS